MHIQDYHTDHLHIDHFRISPGEAWCLYGSNTSGISEFIRLLEDMPAHAEKISCRNTPTVISFAAQQAIYERELRNDNSDFEDRIDPGTPARDFITAPEKYNGLLRDFNLLHCLDKGYRQLSSGESRKLLLISSISRNPGILVIESPYDGLDVEGCLELDRTLSKLHNLGYQIVVSVNNRSDIPCWCSHLAIFQQSHIALQGTRENVLQHFNELQNSAGTSSFQLRENAFEPENEEHILVQLRDGFARYGNQLVFKDLQLTISSYQHTLITGPNGSGKSTLLQIISGDNQNCYGNTLEIFGKKRGSGESIWDLKKDMGIVSPDLHRNYYVPGSALQAVLSGLFDSIGIYRQVTEKQKAQAMQWLEMIGLGEKALLPFRRLSYGEQRLCLIARALIKMPRLLILDEPTQGLDQYNRSNLLDFLEKIALQKRSTIIYAGHRKDEYRPFFQLHIDLSAT
ncbi:MAG: ATP-binding cassette domain-containing protein [Desulfopila sp.]|jgi:molybdate transport system ATP-binding protein|nr:ATP-binding cassette domain-containing protein [Desulfopila sp.]